MSDVRGRSKNRLSNRLLRCLHHAISEEVVNLMEKLLYTYRRAIKRGRLPSHRSVEAVFKLHCDKYGDYLLNEDYVKNYSIMSKFRTLFGFALVTQEHVNKIVSWCRKTERDLLSVGAGTGYVEQAMLSAYVPNVIVTDNWEKCYKHTVGKFCPIRKLRGENAIEKWPDRNVLMSWPPYCSEWPATVAGHMEKDSLLFYIGEHDGGCCASDDFFHVLNKQFTLVEEVPIRSFHGMWDSFYIYQRRSTK